MSSGSADHSTLFDALERELRQLNVVTAFFFQAIADQLGLDVSAVQCSNLLDLLGPLTAGQLAELTGLTTGAITAVVDRLERAGYVARERDPHDRRRVIVRPLPEGGRRAAPLFEPMGQAWAELYARYSPQELAAILDFAGRATQMTLAQTNKLRGTAETPARGGDFAAPLAGVTAGHLIFELGASRLTLRADRALSDLYRAHFTGTAPEVRVRGGTVTIRAGFSLAALFGRGITPAEVTLNGAIPWTIEIRSGAAQLTADLRTLTLRALDLTGGVNRATLSLADPTGTVPITVTGGASKLTLHRPAGVAARIAVTSGFTNLVFDGRRIGGGADRQWATPDYDRATDRYDVRVTGGASDLTVDVGV
ncbi:MAG: MarR family winged helix-turn-helix transcriptional regulator [Thermomicrobiales bacterium]